MILRLGAGQRPERPSDLEHVAPALDGWTASAFRARTRSVGVAFSHRRVVASSVRSMSPCAIAATASLLAASTRLAAVWTTTRAAASCSAPGRHPPSLPRAAQRTFRDEGLHDDVGREAEHLLLVGELPAVGCIAPET